MSVSPPPDAGKRPLPPSVPDYEVRDALPLPPTRRSVAEPERRVWLERRRAIMIELSAIEDFLGLRRTVKRQERLEERAERQSGVRVSGPMLD